MNATSYYWIETAMAMGGRLSVRRPPHVLGKDLAFIGRMTWHLQGFVQGEPAVEFDRALRNLDSALQKDAAEDMIERGGA